MRIGQKLTVGNIWSVTGQSCEVVLLEVDRQGPTLFIEYPNGYQEWLPISAFIGY
jgi:hypothetical protein